MIIYLIYQNEIEVERFKKNNFFNLNIIFFKSFIFSNTKYNYNNIPIYNKFYDIYYKDDINSNQSNHQLTIKMILEDAIDNDYKEIMILEYDIYFHKNYNCLYNKYKKLIDCNDIIHLGSSQHYWYDLITKEPIKIKNYNNLKFYTNNHSLGTFAIILKNKVYLEYLNFINYNLSTIKKFPSDVILSIISKNYKSIVLYPNLIICDITKSTIKPENRKNKNLHIKFKWNYNNYII